MNAPGSVPTGGLTAAKSSTGGDATRLAREGQQERDGGGAFRRRQAGPWTVNEEGAD